MLVHTTRLSGEIRGTEPVHTAIHKMAAFNVSNILFTTSVNCIFGHIDVRNFLFFVTFQLTWFFAALMGDTRLDVSLLLETITR